MSWAHLAAIVPVYVLGCVALEWLARRRVARLKEELDFVHECCCGKR